MVESTQHNFGRNVEFTPKRIFDPRDENEVRQLLAEHQGRSIRAIGSLHSWSEAPVGEDIVVRLAHFDEVELSPDRKSVTIGAGCSIYRALEALRRENLTLPAVGMTGEQTLAGAIATATHGSGRPSLSHYVSEVLLASYGEGGEPVVRWISGGAALRAARCSLGRMGIVLALRMPAIDAYLVEEEGRMLDTLEDVLEAADGYELTQFYLMPWSWKWMIELRRVVKGPRSNFGSRVLFQLKRRFNVAVLHCVSVAVARRKYRWRAPAAYRLLTRLYSPSSVIDYAENVLMMKHRNRYVETELFVPLKHLPEAARFVKEMLRYVGGDAYPVSAEFRDLIEAHAGGFGALEQLRGEHTPHYPITFRRVLKDDTAISMSSGEEDMFAISIVTVDEEDEGYEIFRKLVALLSSAMAAAFGARPHWGKVITLDATDLAGLYPNLAELRAECERTDPNGAFSTKFTKDVLGF